MRRSSSNKLQFRDVFFLSIGAMAGFLLGALATAWFTQAVGP